MLLFGTLGIALIGITIEEVMRGLVNDTSIMKVAGPMYIEMIIALPFVTKEDRYVSILAEAIRIIPQEEA